MKRRLFHIWVTIKGEKFPFVVFGNKLDKESERTVQQEKAQSWCESHKNIKYFEVSALNFTNVQSAFEEIAKIVDSQEREIGVFPVALANNDTQKQAKKTIFQYFVDLIILYQNQSERLFLKLKLYQNVETKYFFKTCRKLLYLLNFYFVIENNNKVLLQLNYTNCSLNSIIMSL